MNGGTDGSDRRTQFFLANNRAAKRADSVTEVVRLISLSLLDGTSERISNLPVPKPLGTGAVPIDAFSDQAVTHSYDRIRSGLDMVAQFTLVLDGQRLMPGGSTLNTAERANAVLDRDKISRLPPQEAGTRMPQENPTVEDFIAANVRDVLAAEKTLTGIIDHLAAVGTRTPEAAQYWKDLLRTSARDHPIPEAVGLPREAGTDRTPPNIANALRKPGPQHGRPRPGRGHPGGPTRGPGRGSRRP